MRTNLARLFLIVIVFLFLGGIIKVLSSVTSALASLFVKGLVILFVIELCLGRDQIAHAAAHLEGSMLAA